MDHSTCVRFCGTFRFDRTGTINGVPATFRHLPRSNSRSGEGLQADPVETGL